MPSLRSMTIALAATVLSLTPFVQACKSAGSAGPGAADAPADVAPPPPAAPEPDAEAAPDAIADAAPTSATPHAAPVRPSGPPAAGNACAPKEPKESSACAPGGFEELACSGGVWKVAQICRGPGGCKSDAAGVHCDPGTPLAGDACGATAVPRCANVHTVFTCKNGSWESSLCVPPSKCVPSAKNGVAGCK
jgi:hypothetical protein